MHEKHDLEKRLKFEASRISDDIGGAPVVIVIVGIQKQIFQEQLRLQASKVKMFDYVIC